ncbi:MAG: glycoside hydrolase family 5 protein [Bdellovibrionaceae bacterium]|nr:glycoside hydrolase family 5 protein [Pseudobdellovibrionaceae bacterium]
MRVARIQTVFGATLLLATIAFGFQNCGQSALMMNELPAREGLDAAPTPTPDPTPVVEKAIFYPGVNLSGGEYNEGKPNAQLFTDYVFPNQSQMKYYADKGLKVIRLPFDGNRLQPTRNGALDTTELGHLRDVVNAARSEGLIVILDPHNYGKLRMANGNEGLIGIAGEVSNAEFADFWARVAVAFKNDANVWFGIMNEPFVQTASYWQQSAAAAVAAIRATGAKHKVLVPGTSWTGGHSWISSGNAQVWEGFQDSNFAIEIHQYLDSDSSGTSATCIADSHQRLNGVTAWARAQGVQLFLGEIGWSTNALCMSEGDAVMALLTTNRDVWLGYSYWSGGPWLGSYMFTIEPDNGVDRAQMDVLVRNFPPEE